MGPITIHLLGPFEVQINGEQVTSFHYAKVRALLAYLALESHRPQPRSVLAALLWPEEPERAARSSLSQALATLRNALGDRHASQPVLLANADTVQLDPTGLIQVDVAQFLGFVNVAEAHAHYSWRTCNHCATLLQQALALYRDNFLKDFYIPDSAAFEEWAGLQREYLLQRALSALSRLAEWAEWRGVTVEALAYARRLVALDPLLEVNQRVLIRLLALNGEPAAALAQFAQYRGYLAQELQAEPEPETLELVRQIQRGDVESLRARPPPFSVPTPPTPIIGRAEAVHEIEIRLRAADTRFLTIIGTGGVGKTRLAIEIAHRLRFDFEDGVHFVDLSPLSEVSLVPAAFVQVFGLQGRTDQDISQSLLSFLRSKHLLLVCDNFEHVLPAASLASEILAACPLVKVLATSREPLYLRAEQQFNLEPLSERDTLALFLLRARAAGTDLAVNEDSLAVYAGICQRTDGLPLAVELTAARTRLLPPRELLRQLEQPLQAIEHGWRDAPERHRGLRAAIQWSYDLLDKREQRVFAHLGVFASGCTADAAQAVVGEETPVAASLERLQAASLAQTHQTPDETRFILLSTLREFALEKLAEGGEEQEAHRRLAQFIASLAEAAEPALKGPEQTQWIKRLEAERENIRASLVWCNANDPTLGLRIAVSLWYFYELRGSIREGRDWLNAFTEIATAAPPALRANALCMSGSLDYRTGQYVPANRKVEEGLKLYEELNQLEGVASAHNILGNIALDQEQYSLAIQHYQKCLEYRREVGDRYGIASVLNNLAVGTYLSGSIQEAEKLYRESLSLYREVGDPGKVASVIRNLAVLALQRKDPGQAERLYQESLAMCLEMDYRRGIGLSQHGLGQAALMLNDLSTTWERFVSALRLFVELMDPIEVSESLIGLAHTAQVGQAFEFAARLLGAVERIVEDQQMVVRGETRLELDQVVKDTQAGLGSRQYEQARLAGRGMSLEQVVALVRTPPGMRPVDSLR